MIISWTNPTNNDRQQTPAARGGERTESPVFPEGTQLVGRA